MELNRFTETAYRMIQRIYSTVNWERWIGGLRTRWESRTVGGAISGTLRFVLIAVLLGLLIDWALYWTREDQTSLLRRTWRRLRDFLVSGEGR